MMMYHALFESVLRYGFIGWGRVYDYRIKDLEIIQKRIKSDSSQTMTISFESVVPGHLCSADKASFLYGRTDILHKEYGLHFIKPRNYFNGHTGDALVPKKKLKF